MWGCAHACARGQGVTKPPRGCPRSVSCETTPGGPRGGEAAQVGQDFPAATTRCRHLCPAPPGVTSAPGLPVTSLRQPRCHRAATEPGGGGGHGRTQRCAAAGAGVTPRGRGREVLLKGNRGWELINEEEEEEDGRKGRRPGSLPWTPRRLPQQLGTGTGTGPQILAGLGSSGVPRDLGSSWCLPRVPDLSLPPAGSLVGAQVTSETKQVPENSGECPPAAPRHRGLPHQPGLGTRLLPTRGIPRLSGSSPCGFPAPGGLRGLPAPQLSAVSPPQRWTSPAQRTNTA